MGLAWDYATLIAMTKLIFHVGTTNLHGWPTVCLFIIIWSNEYLIITFGQSRTVRLDPWSLCFLVYCPSREVESNDSTTHLSFSYSTWFSYVGEISYVNCVRETFYLGKFRIRTRERREWTITSQVCGLPSSLSQKVFKWLFSPQEA